MYNTEINPINKMDADEIKRLHESGASRTIKREYVKRGYNNMMSLYGALHNDDDGTRKGIRIEILSDTPYTEKIVYGLYQFFKELRVIEIYSIWIYDGKTDSLKLIWDGVKTFND